MEYNRLIAYIYSYNNGMKTKNTGFAKIEVRSGILKLQLNMKCAYTDGPSDWNVYYFTRVNSLECGIGLGHITLRNGMGEFKSQEPAENIGGSGVEFKDIAGMYLSCGRDGEKVFASEWDDLGFDVEKISYELKEKIKPEQPVVYEAAQIPQEPGPVIPEMRECPECPEVPDVPEPSNQSDWWELFDDRDKYHLFADDDIYDCVEITPDDIAKMPDTNWALQNNSFINHGYYTFRHLIVGKLNDLERCRYVIGVPGIYTRRDRSTAAMYGFNHFKFSMRSDIRLSQFGYWYKELEC